MPGGWLSEHAFMVALVLGSSSAFPPLALSCTRTRDAVRALQIAESITMTLHFLPQLVLVEVLVLGGVLFVWLQNFEQNPSSIMVSLGSPGPRRNCAVALVILWQLNSRRLKHVLNARSQFFRRHDDDDEVFFF